LHAFDLDRVAGAQLTVRRAHGGEQVQTLDGQTRTLTAEMVLIADAQGPTSIAGVMGGTRSEVEAGTTRVLMEVANWNGANIHRTSLTLGLRSEASGRYEKQLQPEQTIDAQALAAALMIALCGARLAPGTIDIGGPGPALKTIRLRDARIASLLGAPIARERCDQILRALEFSTAPAPDGLDVTVPAFLRRALDALAAQGLHEIVGWSFVSPELPTRLRLPESGAIRLANPMSAEQSQLRTTLLGGLLDVAQRNRSRGVGALALFEAGAVSLPAQDGERPAEPLHVAALLSGPVRRSTWREPDPPRADFFAAKGVLGAMLDTLRVPWSVAPGDEPFLHPGRAARILVAGEAIGWLGELHPQVAAGWDQSDPMAGFELDLDAAAAHATA